MSLKRAYRHALIGFSSLGAAAAIFFNVERLGSVAFKFSMATAYPALVLLCVTLVIGPLKLVRRRPNPVSTHLRRDIGIWAGVLGLIHVVAGLQVHLNGRFWFYFIFPPEHEAAFPLRYDAAGLANYSGLLATIVILLLLAISNNHFLRLLKSKRWKRLQRWNYVLFGSVAVHAFVYQGLEGRAAPWTITISIAVLVVLVAQGIGITAHRTANGPPVAEDLPPDTR